MDLLSVWFLKKHGIENREGAFGFIIRASWEVPSLTIEWVKDGSSETQILEFSLAEAIAQELEMPADILGFTLRSFRNELPTLSIKQIVNAWVWRPCEVN